MWLKEDNDETHMIECEVTKVFAEISDEIYEILLFELLNEIPFKNLL